MPLDHSRFRRRAFLTSLFFLSVIIVAIWNFATVLNGDGFADTRIINITADIFCMVLGYIIFACCVLDIPKNERNLNCFLLLLFVDFMAAFLDELAWIVDGKPDLVNWNIGVNTVYYMTAPCLAFLFWRYVITYLDLSHRLLDKYNLILEVGLGLAVIMRLINVPTGIYFKVGSDGVYDRGALYLLSNAYTYVTLLLTVQLVYVCRKRFKKYQVVTLIFYAIAPLAVGVMTIFTYGLSIVSPVIMMVFLLMYCVLNTVQSRERSISENELQMATVIQENMLPHIFPAFPHRSDFDLYASMTPARDVGGDLYDFYLADDDHLVITIADVSGKGVPAALFMMVTKTLLKNRGLTDYDDCSKMLERVNDMLCEGNELDMFVTAWVGVLTLSTGELHYANAGHEYPAIKRNDRGFELIKDRHLPPLGAMEGLTYKQQKMTLKPGEILYLYTDGVTEAVNDKKEFFGEERMIQALNLPFERTMEKLDANVREKITEFTGGAEQFDDITMLCLRYNGPQKES